MSVIKFEIENDSKMELLDFLTRFHRLNKELEFTSDKNSSYFFSDDYVEKFVIPSNYVIKKSNNDMYIFFDNNKLLRMCYYPYVGMKEIMTSKEISMNILDIYNFNTEKEYYLEKASVETAKKYGIGRLKSAVQAAKNKNYNGFTRDEGARTLAKKIKPEELTNVMIDTLNKDRNYVKKRDELLYENELEELYYQYINEKINKKGLKK